MGNVRFKLVAIATLSLTAAFFAEDARSSGTPRPVTPNASDHGFASVYGIVPADQSEEFPRSTADRIKSAAASGAPTLVWEALEHGEKIECLDCISAVSPLLYDSNGKTREIAAWWLRRRIFGVFGSGEVYEQTIRTLANDGDPVRRSYAAYALGEFFAAPGIAACAQAVIHDGDGRVRAAAAMALGRLNDDGAGALGAALQDTDSRVKLAALASAARINTFSTPSAVAALTMDPDPAVRRRAVGVLDALRATDTVAVVAAAAQNDGDAGVRAAACHALGDFGDPSALPVVQALASGDADTFVRDQAQIALRKL